MLSVIDCTLGLVLSIGGLKLLDYVANERDWVSLKHSGVYHGRQGVFHWINQLVAWFVILTVVKVIVCFVMWLTSEWLAYAGAFFFEPLQENIRFELLFVMIFFPGIMNIIYFWITDSYLKAAGHHKHAHESEAEMFGGEISMSHTHSFDIIDTGGMIKEGLDMCTAPSHAQSVRESAVYDPKTETLVTKQHYAEMYGKIGVLHGTADRNEAVSSAGVSSITGGSVGEGGYVGPTLEGSPPATAETTTVATTGGRAVQEDDGSEPKGTFV